MFEIILREAIIRETARRDDALLNISLHPDDPTYKSIALYVQGYLDALIFSISLDSALKEDAKNENV